MCVCVCVCVCMCVHVCACVCVCVHVCACVCVCVVCVHVCVCVCVLCVYVGAVHVSTEHLYVTLLSNDEPFSEKLSSKYILLNSIKKNSMNTRP